MEYFLIEMNRRRSYRSFDFAITRGNNLDFSWIVGEVSFVSQLQLRRRVADLIGKVWLAVPLPDDEREKLLEAIDEHARGERDEGGDETFHIFVGLELAKEGGAWEERDGRHVYTLLYRESDRGGIATA